MFRSFLKLFAIATLFSFSISTYAQDEVALILKMKNDATEYYVLLADKPVMKFDSQKLVFESERFSTEVDNIAKFYFDDNVIRENLISIQEAVSINEISPAKKAVVLSYLDGNTIIVKGAVDVSSVNVFTVDGRQTKARINKGKNCAEVDLSSLVSGTYIIKVNKQSFKINKK